MAERHDPLPPPVTAEAYYLRACMEELQQIRRLLHKQAQGVEPKPGTVELREPAEAEPKRRTTRTTRKKG